MALTAAMLPAGSASANFPTTAGYYPMVNWQTGLCVDGSVSQGVKLKPCTGSNYQQWGYHGDTFDVVNMQSELCLDGSVSYGVRLNTCNRSDYQAWYWV